MQRAGCGRSQRCVDNVRFSDPELLLRETGLMRSRKNHTIIVISVTCAASLVIALASSASPSQYEALPLKTNVPLQSMIADLEQYIPAQMKAADVPGLSIAIVRNGELVWARGFGVRDGSTKVPVTADTVFEPASIGKPISAYGALLLRDRGLIQLDKPLSSYLKEQYLPASRYRDEITMRHVLSHTTGLANNPFMWTISGIHFKPGSRFSYSGVGFGYLQAAIEQVTGKSFSPMMRDEVFQPLAMESSSYERSPALDLRVAKPYYDPFGIEIPSPDLGAYGSPRASNLIRSTAPDIARFMCELMNPKHLSEATIREMMTEQVTVGDGVSWGLGIGLQHSGAGDAFWQWGDDPGFKSLLVGYRKDKIGVVVLTRGSGGYEILGKIAQRAIGGPDGPYWHAVKLISF